MTACTKITALLLAAGLVLLAVAGCGDNEFLPVSNEPPETGLAVTGDVDTTFYTVNMRWWGSDPDGEVSGYEYRWSTSAGAEVFDLDTAWTFTGFTAKSFHVPVTDSSAVYTFRIRAVDDQGAVDPTPAEQEYPFYNHPPFGEIRFKELLPDSSWPVIAFGWNSSDPDGDSTIAANLVWVGGREDRPIELPGDADSIILKPAQLDTSGDVTIYFQTVDQGYAAGPLDSFDIYLYEVKGSILLVDDYDKTPSHIVNPDAFYRDFLNDRVGEDGYTVLDLDKRPFDTDVRFEAFLSQFDDVIWYSGIRQRSRIEDPDEFGQMSLVDSVMGLYLQRDGGHFFLSSLNGIGTFGGFGEERLQQVLGVPKLFRDIVSGSTSFEFIEDACHTGTLFAMEGTGLPDLELQCPITFPGIDSPDTTSGLDVELLYRLPAGVMKHQYVIHENADTVLVDSFFVGDSLVALDTLVAVDDTVGVGFYPAFRKEFSGGGKAIVCCFPFSLYYGAGNNDEVLGQFLDWFDSPSRKR